MLRGRSVQRMGIAGGLVILSVGAFALGSAMSETMRPLPAVVPATSTSQLGMPPVSSATPPSSHGAMQAPPADALPPQAFQAPTPTMANSAGDLQAATPSSQQAAPTTLPVSAAVADQRVADAPPSQTAEAPDSPLDLRRAQARKAADRHWQGRDNAQSAPTPERAGAGRPPQVAVAPPADTPAPQDPLAPPGRSTTVDGTDGLGFLAAIAGLPQALVTIQTGSAAAWPDIDSRVRAVLANRDDSGVWDNLASALERAGQRSAAIAVANFALEAAKRTQDGNAVNRLTRQIAQFELSGKEAASPPKSPPVSRQTAAQVKPAVAGGQPKAETSPASSTAPDKLDAELDNALRNNAAAEALKILQQMAQGSIARGDFAAAQKSYNAALNLAHLSRLGEQRADQYANLGRLNWKKGDRGEAEAYLRAARDQYEQFDLTAKAAEMTALLRQISPSAVASPSQPTQSGKRTSSIIELR